ncbi:hypothetical protein F5Y05DRAFT_216032 [Hypoxylon sp. FL0543]|nr:hypothetical protein F5Y05DRAFT_216032 [Hypoxylon sp. FL0543]
MSNLLDWRRLRRVECMTSNRNLLIPLKHRGRTAALSRIADPLPLTVTCRSGRVAPKCRLIFLKMPPVPRYNSLGMIVRVNRSHEAALPSTSHQLNLINSDVQFLSRGPLRSSSRLKSKAQRPDSAEDHAERITQLIRPLYPMATRILTSDAWDPCIFPGQATAANGKLRDGFVYQLTGRAFRQHSRFMSILTYLLVLSSYGLRKAHEMISRPRYLSRTMNT